MSYPDSSSTVAPSRLSCPSCPVIPIISSSGCPISYPGCTNPTAFAGCLIRAFLSRLSCLGYRVPAVLFQYSWRQFTYPCCPVLAFMSWPSSPPLPVQASLSAGLFQLDLSRLPCPIVRPLSCTRCPGWTVLSWSSCHAYPFRLSCPGFPVLAVMFLPFCPLFSVLLVYPNRRLRLSCRGFPVPAALSPFPCLHCPFPVVFAPAFCPQISSSLCPVFAGTFSLSCHICFVLDALF